MDRSNEQRGAPPSGPGGGISPSKARWIIRLAVAVVASAVSFFLSWPYWRDFSYWPESKPMWMLYFVVGFLLAIYVFHVFLGVLGTLFEHDAIERARLAEADGDGGRP
ncbi:hypothetical protein [Pikeienuella sp. HZG-20]|uniref:hypothetical protein n=1 Tax=Paludibacillus litoralis TaxID=3133267 RepID=UPI0030EC9945